MDKNEAYEAFSTQAGIDLAKVLRAAFDAGWDAGRGALHASLSEVLSADAPQEDPEPTLWGYKVGDRVRYTKGDAGPAGAERTVLRIDAEGIALADPSSAYGANTAIGYAIYAQDIERVPTEPQVGDLVRVVDEPADKYHAGCAGLRGTLEGPDRDGEYFVEGNGAHYGPLSDFEKVEEN